MLLKLMGPKYGEIIIKTTTGENNVDISVRDTGSGIAAKDLKRIFDPFFTIKPIGDGTGLGLSIAFGIVERHGGHIAVDSRLDVGTTFMIRLPQHFEPDPVPTEKTIVPYVEV